ncbi:MAG: type III-B CRISPR-associated protein Cas10/Cmr2 [Xanthomonadales bacterium]|nr:type III-B CRISPR-associated protein Cas10/Cmr2 [Xanthomonadales bacterium]
MLLRDPEGHENGTSRALARLLGYHELPEALDPDSDDALVRVLVGKAGFGSQIPAWMYRHVRRADWWAAAADRPQWPLRERAAQRPDGAPRSFALDPNAQVRWTDRPVLIHPLTGDEIDLGKLADVSIAEAKQTAFDHLSSLLVDLGAGTEQEPDFRKILLAFWRFGPELRGEADRGGFGSLWALLPADTRVPDHSIWDHLDLTSALAGAFAADPEGDAALLVVSIGPVQGFIAEARKLEDLWAGSHLLSRLAWETIRPLADELGPDAILFPRLRGVAIVDLWLLKAMGLPDRLFEKCEWRRAPGDANPLFAASLPNRFVAIVPASRAAELASRCEQSAREWILKLGERTVERLLREAGAGAIPNGREVALAQMREQLAGFPEVHWAAVPFSLIRCRDEERQRDLDLSALVRAMAPFYGVAEDQASGFLASPAWRLLSREIELELDGQHFLFHAPNPGALYPAIYELAERLLAAAKAIRRFSSLRQEGWRDSLSGEVEWLTEDRSKLWLTPGQRRQPESSLWSRIAARRPAWAKAGEHLGALGAIKRLWPTLFAEELREALDTNVSRHMVSTHAMALAHHLDAWLERGSRTRELDKLLGASGSAEEVERAPDAETESTAGEDWRWVVLPRRILRRHRGRDELRLARQLPALLEEASETEDEPRAERLREAVRRTLATALPEEKRHGFRLETYYGLLLMDGDRMGALLSGAEQSVDATERSGEQPSAMQYGQSFHKQVRSRLESLAKDSPALEAYLSQPRPVSPARHVAISAALSDFSQHVARHVVEEEHFGKLIYSGGDDVLAVLPAADLISCARRLRHAYSGTLPDDESVDWREIGRRRGELHCKSGFAFLNGRLMRMMGKGVTASAGLVIAHHQSPLGAVLRELRAAEGRAKDEGGRDALSLTILKRSGSRVTLSLKWQELPVLEATIRFLAAPETSRRAVYHSLAWLDDLPPLSEANGEMLERLLAYQLARQSRGRKEEAAALARQLASFALVPAGGVERSAGRMPAPRERLAALMTAAEFLAREIRQPAAAETSPDARREAVA